MKRKRTITSKKQKKTKKWTNKCKSNYYYSSKKVKIIFFGKNYGLCSTFFFTFYKLIKLEHPLYTVFFFQKHFYFSDKYIHTSLILNYSNFPILPTSPILLLHLHSLKFILTRSLLPTGTRTDIYKAVVSRLEPFSLQFFSCSSLTKW